MAHIGEFNVNTQGGYKKLADLTGAVFEDGKTYLLQIRNPATIIISAEAPESGGFYISNNEIFSYTKTAGEDLYIKTAHTFASIVNISE